jgi:hypothetical protein
MESALNLLKQEINATSKAAHDLAKWKLVVTAALGAAAFGLAQNNPKYWLLLFVPFVCAYIDLFDYQLQLRILVIARFLQKHREGDGLLQRYEQECEALRGLGKYVFSLDKWAGISCSLGVCASGPVLYYFMQRQPACQDYLGVPFPCAVAIWLFGVFLIVFLYVISKVIAREVPGTSDSGPSAQVT